MIGFVLSRRRWTNMDREEEEEEEKEITIGCRD
jgi:hypothetical protein